jgi:nucleoside-diphosphate-sugar epimerase
VEKPDDFIKPAVAGTVSAMKAASKEPKVKRVVITSSYAS